MPARLAVGRDVDPPYRFSPDRAHTHGPGFAVVDAIGGLRPAGSAAGWDEAPAAAAVDGRVVAVGGGHDGGYLLTVTGSVVAFGRAAPVTGRPAGETPVSDIVVRPEAAGGWVLDRSGTLHGFGGAGSRSPAAPVAEALAAGLVDGGAGQVLDATGRLHAVGGAADVGLGATGGAEIEAVDLALTGAAAGWILDRSGRLHGFGGASSHQVSVGDEPVAVTAAVTGTGGWVLDRDGQLWPFGGAPLIFPVSTNATDGNIVDVDHLGVVRRRAFLDGGDASFIGAAYRLLEGREATVDDLDREATRLEQGTRRYELALGLARSDHWSGANIDRMYGDVLGRAPDEDGRRYWLDQIRSGLALQDLGTYFYGSAEYAAGAGSHEAYVTRLYQTLLRRPPDPEGLAYWVGLLDTGGATPPDVAAGFYASIESRRDRSTRLHIDAMGREPGADEREALAERLLGTGDVELMAELVASSEYYQRAGGGGS